MFENKRTDVIRHCMVINDAMVDVIKAGMWKGSYWIVKVVMHDEHDLC